MIPSLLDELKGGRFYVDSVIFGHNYRESDYITESLWKVEVIKNGRSRPEVKVNGKKVSWLFGWKIRRAIKKGMKHEQTKS